MSRKKKAPKTTLAKLGPLEIEIDELEHTFHDDNPDRTFIPNHYDSRGPVAPEIVEDHRAKPAAMPHEVGIHEPYAPHLDAVHDWLHHARGPTISPGSVVVTPDSRAPADVIQRADDIHHGRHLLHDGDRGRLRMERDSQEWMLTGNWNDKARDVLTRWNRWTPVRVLRDLDGPGWTLDRGACGIWTGVNSEGEVIVELPTWEPHAPARRMLPPAPPPATITEPTGAALVHVAPVLDERCVWRNVRLPEAAIAPLFAEDLCPLCNGFGDEPPGLRCENCGGSGLRPNKGEKTCQTKRPLTRSKHSPRKSRA